MGGWAVRLAPLILLVRLANGYIVRSRSISSSTARTCNLSCVLLKHELRACKSLAVSVLQSCAGVHVCAWAFHRGEQVVDRAYHRVSSFSPGVKQLALQEAQGGYYTAGDKDVAALLSKDGGAQQAVAAAAAEKSVEASAEVTVRKPISDKRQFKHTTFANGLRVVIRASCAGFLGAPVETQDFLSRAGLGPTRSMAFRLLETLRISCWPCQFAASCVPDNEYLDDPRCCLWRIRKQRRQHTQWRSRSALSTTLPPSQASRTSASICSFWDRRSILALSGIGEVFCNTFHRPDRSDFLQSRGPDRIAECVINGQSPFECLNTGILTRTTSGR